MINNTKTLIEFYITNYIAKSDICVDMTCGNGHDSKFILDHLSPKKLYAFDIQEEAKYSTYRLLQDYNLDNFRMILDNHKYVTRHVYEKVDFAIYNLGYLPAGNKSITTNFNDVIDSLKNLLKILNIHAKVIITFYPGHESGKKEADEVIDFLTSLSQREYVITKFDFINQKNNPPFVVILESLIG